MKPAPDGDVTPIRVPASLQAALAITGIVTVVFGVLPGIISRYGELYRPRRRVRPLTRSTRVTELPRSTRPTGHVRTIAGRSVAGCCASTSSCAWRSTASTASTTPAGAPAAAVGLPDVAGGRAAVRCGPRPGDRRRGGGTRRAGRLHRHRGRRRSGHARPGDPRRRAGCTPRYVAVEVVGGAARPTIPTGSSRVAELPEPRSPGSSSPTSCSTTCRSAWPCSTAGGGGVRRRRRRRHVRARCSATPLDPVPLWLPSTAPHGAACPDPGRRRGVGSRGATGVIDAGRVVAIDYAVARTAELALRPWREWLRTYRGHERGGHYLADPGRQDITAEVALDQLPARPTRCAPRRSSSPCTASTSWSRRAAREWARPTARAPTDPHR